MKKTLSLLLIALFVISTGCATITKYAEMGMKEGEKALDREARKFVDKEAGEGSYEDYNKLKDDKNKVEMVYPYLVKLNKAFTAKKINKEERDAAKAQVHAWYKDFTDGKIDAKTYNKKCTELTLAKDKENKKE